MSDAWSFVSLNATVSVNISQSFACALGRTLIIDATVGGDIRSAERKRRWTPLLPVVRVSGFPAGATPWSFVPPV